MNDREAAEVSEQYKKRGNDVVITGAFDGPGVYVFVYSGVVKNG